MRKDAVDFLTEHYSDLTAGERRLVSYLISDLDLALTLSVKSLSEKAGVSVATVVRLAQHLGFDGYKALRLHLAGRRSGHEDFVLDFEKSGSTLRQQVQKVLNADMDCIQLTLQDLCYPTLEAVAEQIRTSENILLFGVATSYVVCRDMALKLQRVGRAATCCETPHDAALTLARFSPRDLVIGISHSGENADTCRVLRIARKFGIPSAAVTTFPGSSICALTDLVLYSKTRESPLHKIAITSRTSQFAVMDALFTAYFTLDHKRCMEAVQRLSILPDRHRP